MTKVLEFWPDEKTEEFKERVVLRYKDMVYVMAKMAHRKLPANYELDDLVSCGMIGLLIAIERFDKNRGVLFKTFAEYRIRGAILDELRNLDWASRNLRDKIKMTEEAQNKLERNLGRVASMQEVRKELKMAPKEFYSLMTKVQPFKNINILSPSVLYSHDKEVVRKLTAKSEESDPFKITDRKNTQKWLLFNFNKLPKRQASLMKMYYFDNLTMKEISKQLNLTESRISQLHNLSLTWIKEEIEQGDLIAA